MTGKWKHIIICPDRSLFQSLTALLSDVTPGSPVLDYKTYPSRRAVVDAVSTQGANICFLDVGSSWDSALALMSELTTLNPAIPVVAIHTGNDPDLILRSLRQGASEFLFQPFTGEQLMTALERLARLRVDHNIQSSDLAKVYCVMPGKGACGATTVACNLAFRMQKASAPKKVLLADLDSACGTLSFLLKLRSNYSFVDALLHSANMDEDLWKALVTSQQGVDIILSPENPLDGQANYREAPAMIDYSRQIYGSVIMDTSGPYGEWNLALARLSDEILLVTTNELPALHSSQKALAQLERNGIDRSKIRLIVNRFNPDAGLGREAIEMALHLDVFHVIPSDYEAMQRSLLEAKPVPTNSSFGKNINSMAERLTGRQAQAKRHSLLSGIFSLFDSAFNRA